MKVLIIEDEPLVARLYEKTLKFDGFEVSIANGGNEGLTKTKAEKPDLVLLDIMMPEPDGIEVLDKLKKDEETKGIPVVILTNLSGKHDAELALSKGADDYWIKRDAEPKDLGKMIKGILNRKPAGPN
ncbi:hypothetical protein A2Z22_05195 [Candidatus Woesebacteria bacterium RBG_16_34_12]|uniref:Response regulatory domain-containing protein n=1 Tax=Candidatus Woesebacteria bacterium RBG_16_34_12 TaxID=1802480 RepID=A0A1F7XB18_9BACT|nr:MAG: hypothetical protein A2Z22_05195 [Candidatus Woesebacteria bacterium RBG_16_34_12]